jgi:hypothetical protein
MVLVYNNRRSSIPIRAPQSPSVLPDPPRRCPMHSALLSLEWCFERSFRAPDYRFCLRSSNRMGAPQSPLQTQLGAPLFHCRLFTSLPVRRCSAWMCCSLALALLNPCQRALAWICANQFHSASPSALPLTTSHNIRHSSFPCGAPLFHPNSLYYLSNSILIQH